MKVNEYITYCEFAQIWGGSVNSLYVRKSLGKDMPPIYKRDGGRPRFKRSEVYAWIENRDISNGEV
jgi:hypothetical protein